MRACGFARLRCLVVQARPPLAPLGWFVARKLPGGMLLQPPSPVHCVFCFRCLPFGFAMRKAGSTLGSSRAVPHPSSNWALRRLTSEVGRDPVHSTRYGRQQNLGAPRWCPQKLQASVRPLEIFQNLKFLRWEFRGL